MTRCLRHEELPRLKRWNTPAIYNGWEQITRHDRTMECRNPEETRDFMSQMGPMIGLGELNQAVNDFTRCAEEKYGRKGEV